MFLQPNNTSNNSLKAFQIALGMVNSMGATGTIAEGQPGRNMPRAGNAVQSLISLGMADTQDLSELIEQEVLTPGLADIYKVAIRFMPDEQLINIPGGQSLFGQSAILKKEQILGDYEFDWVGSLQFQDDQQRAQRMMIFLNMMPTLAPMLAQQGFAFNAVELIQNIWRYSLGERSLRDVLVPLKDLPLELAQLQNEEPKSGRPGGMESVPPGGNGNGGGGRMGGGNVGQPLSGLAYSVPSPINGFIQNSNMGG